MHRSMLAALAAGALLLTQTASGVQYVPLHKELTVAAMAMSEGMDPADHAADWLKHHSPDLKKRLESGELDEAEAEARAAAELGRLAEEFDPEEPITLEKSLWFREYDPDREGFRLDPPFQERYFAAPEPHAETLPTSYQVLPANAELAEFLPMPPGEAEAFKARRMSLRGASKRRLGARVSLRLLDFQNRRDFQAVYSRIELFESPDLAEPLHTLVEERDFDELVEGRLLSEGVTWSVSENHSFNYRGIRLLAVLPENHPGYECRAGGDRLAGHRQVHCRVEAYGRGPAEREERLYVGGRLARVVLHRGEGVTDGQRRQLAFELRKLGLSDAGGLEESATWESRGATLHFHPAALEPDAERTGYLVVEAGPFRELAKAGEPDVECDDGEGGEEA